MGRIIRERNERKLRGVDRVMIVEEEGGDRSQYSLLAGFILIPASARRLPARLNMGFH